MSRDLYYNCPICKADHDIRAEVRGTMIREDYVYFQEGGDYWSDEINSEVSNEGTVSFYCDGCGALLLSGPYTEKTYDRMFQLLKNPRELKNASATPVRRMEK